MSDVAARFGMELPTQDPVLIFGLILVLVLVAPVAARKLRLPDIVGLIVAGALVGPHGLELLARDQAIELLGQIGLLYIMFQAGLEIDLDQVNRQRSHTLVFGLTTFALPLVAGIALGVSAYGMSFAVAALFASMFSSHTLVTFPIVTRLGLTRLRPVTTSIGGTIITDILALLVLAIVAATAEGEVTALFWVRLFSFIIAYTLIVLLVIPRLGRRVLKMGGLNDNAQFVFVLTLVFLAGWFAYIAGLEPIIGAFLVGLCLNRIIPERSLLMTRIHFTGDAIFIPFFLLSVGMLVDVRLLVADNEAWAIAAGMLAVALSTKALAAWVSAEVLGYNRRERWLMYGMTVNQAAATLAAVLVGYDLGLFGEAVVTGTILMIAVTCFVGPIITEWAGRAVALAEQQHAHTHRIAPDRILLAVDSRDHARMLFDLALLLRSPTSTEAVYPVSVARESDNVDHALAENERLLAHVVARGIAAEVTVNPVTSLDANIAGGVIRSARENRTPLIAAFWDGSSHGRTHTFGSVLDEIIERSDRMVLISRILHPVATAERLVCIVPPLADREPGFDVAVATIHRLAARSGSRLIVLANEQTLENSGQLLIYGQSEGAAATPQPFTDLRTCLETLPESVEQHDWILVMLARKGEIAWQPALQKAPSRLSSGLPAHNISFLYPPPAAELEGVAAVPVEPRFADSGVLKQDEKAIPALDSVIHPDNCVANAAVTRAEHLLRRMVDTVAWDDQAVRSRVLDELCSIVHDEAIQLEPGIVLLHAHLEDIDERIVLAGSTVAPIDVGGIHSEVRAVIVLLNPRGLDPQLHLETLGRIAREVRREATRRRLGLSGTMRQ